MLPVEITHSIGKIKSNNLANFPPGLKTTRMKLKGIVPRTWRAVEKNFPHTVRCTTVVYYPAALGEPSHYHVTMISSWFSLWGTGKSFKRDYVNLDENRASMRSWRLLPVKTSCSPITTGSISNPSKRP